MSERFISESIEPVLGTADTGRMSAGGPGLPSAFTWGARTIAVREVIRTWRDTAPCTHGSGERYTNKHWFEIRSDAGARMKIYFERKARSAKAARQRWWLFTIDESPKSDSP